MGRFLKKVRAAGHSTAQSIAIPKGGTDSRPVTPEFGDTRFNTDTLALEIFNGTVFHASAHIGEVTLTVDTFTGDGSTTTYTMSKDATAVNQILVFIGSVYQQPTTAYSVLDDEITFTSAPPTGETISVTHNLGSTDAT
jgi:hypothetical protein